VKTEFNIKSEFNTKLVPSSSSSNSSSRHGTVNNHVNSATNQSKSSSKNSSNNSSGSTNNSSSSDSKDSSSKQGVQVNNSTASSSLNNSSSSDSSKKSSNNSSGILKKADLAGNSNAGSGSSTPSSSTKKLHNNDRLSAWAKTLSSRLEKGAFANSIEHDHDAEDFASNIKKGNSKEVKREVLHVNHVRLSQSNAPSLSSLVSGKVSPKDMVSGGVSSILKKETFGTSLQSSGASRGPALVLGPSAGWAPLAPP